MMLFSDRMDIADRFDKWRWHGQYLLESCPENFICYLVSKEGSKDLNKIYEKRDDEKV